MNRASTLSHGLAFALGVLLAWLVLGRSRVPADEFQAVHEAHLAASKDVQRLLGERDRFRAEADSLRAARHVVVRRVLASPDSTARSMGLTVTAPDSGTRCLPVGELGALLADRAALELCDSAGVLRDSADARGDSALGVAVEDAGRLDSALVECAGDLGREEKRLRWLWAAGGAVAAVLAVLGAGSL